MLLATLRDLAKTLRCTTAQAADVVLDERSARASFDRRGLFRAAGAVAGGVCFADVVRPSLALPKYLTVRISYRALSLYGVPLFIAIPESVEVSFNSHAAEVEL